MPMYEYKCAQCGGVFELIQKFADEPLKVHEGCGGAVERLISAPAFQFKGTGWYVTDYAKKNGSSKNSTAAGPAASGSNSSNESKGESKSESKSESKTETKPSTESKPATAAPKP
ncbi:MAG: zinc ribbon domain-containing protein [Acidobacteria bacterium]|nr:zinc ribbon domain-containing protein [Acidobacteriota bacterium]